MPPSVVCFDVAECFPSAARDSVVWAQEFVEHTLRMLGAEEGRSMNYEGRIKAADAAMFDVRCLRFDVKARKSSGMRIAESGKVKGSRLRRRFGVI